jgi:hypothetical protein
MTELVVLPQEVGGLRVTPAGFPDGAEADEFDAGCEKGWRDAFAGSADVYHSKPDAAERNNGEPSHSVRSGRERGRGTDFLQKSVAIVTPRL